MNLGLMLDGECGNVGVGDEVSSDTGSHNELAEYGQMLGTGVKRGYLGQAEPFPNQIDRPFWGDRSNRRSVLGDDPNESRSHHPRKPDSLSPVGHFLPPVAGLLVEWRILVVGVDQQVDVGDDHRSDAT